MANQPYETSAMYQPKVGRMHPDPELVAETVERLAAAKRPIILGGRGVLYSGARDAVIKLADRCGALLSNTLPARGLFHDDPFCIGISGSYTPEVGLEYLKEADFVVAVGCSLAYHAGGGGQLWPKAKMLQIDIDPVAQSQGQEVAKHHLRADARLGVEALSAALPARNESWRTEAMAARIRDSKPDSQVFEIEPGLLDPRDVVEALEKHLPRDWEMVNSGGHCSWFFAQMPSRPQEKFLTIREFGAIGNGISFAMGVSAARPDRTVVLFDGDGSLMMHVQELETIRRHRMKILIVVMNDGAYGNVRRTQVEDFGNRVIASDLRNPDFVKLAESFGVAAFKALDAAELEASLRKAFALNAPALVWVPHGDVPSPWDMIMMPRVRG